MDNKLNAFDQNGEEIKLHPLNQELILYMRKVKNLLYENDIEQISDLDLNFELSKIRYSIGKINTDKRTYLTCPRCGQMEKVYHLKWTAMQCRKCKWEVKKSEWRTLDKLNDDLFK